MRSLGNTKNPFSSLHSGGQHAPGIGHNLQAPFNFGGHHAPGLVPGGLGGFPAPPAFGFGKQFTLPIDNQFNHEPINHEPIEQEQDHEASNLQHKEHDKSADGQSNPTSNMFFTPVNDASTKIPVYVRQRHKRREDNRQETNTLPSKINGVLIFKPKDPLLDFGKPCLNCSVVSSSMKVSN